MKCPSRVPVISKQFWRTPSPKLRWEGRSLFDLNFQIKEESLVLHSRFSGSVSSKCWSLLQPDCTFTCCLPWLTLWGQASILLHCPFNPGASISNKDANYPISYLNLSQYQALAAFQDSPMLSKPVLLGWLLNITTFGCQHKAQLWLPLEHDFYLLTKETLPRILLLNYSGCAWSPLIS